MFKFVIPGKPQGKQRPRWGRNGVYTPMKTREYEKYIEQICAISKKRKFFDNAVQVNITAFFEQGKQDKKKEWAMKKPDADNIAKVILDALNRIIYEDDKQVVKLVVEKKYSDDARVEVEVKEIRGINCLSKKRGK